MNEINLLDTHPKTARDYDKRALGKTLEVIAIAKRFDKDFFDGDRKCGYGGYILQGIYNIRDLQFYSIAIDTFIHDYGTYEDLCSIVGLIVDGIIKSVQRNFKKT